jgi:hypothetical protein
VTAVTGPKHLLLVLDVQLTGELVVLLLHDYGAVPSQLQVWLSAYKVLAEASLFLSSRLSSLPTISQPILRHVAESA